MAEYTGALGVNAQIRFVGKAGSHAVGETWQTGLRIAWSDNGSPWATNTGRVDLEPKTVADAFVNRTTTEFAVSQGWAGVGTIGVPTDADQDTIALAFHDWALASKGRFSNQYELGDVRLYPFQEDGTSLAAPSIYTPLATTADPSGTTSMPLDTAYAMSLGTAVRGPSGRGRMFLGGLAQLILATNGSPNVSVASQLREATVVLLESLRFGGSFDSLSYAPVLHTRNTATGSVIRVVRTNNLFETQRRRDRQVAPVWDEDLVS